MSVINTSSRDQKHTYEMEDIISAPPAWLLRWGIILFSVVLLLSFGLSVLIHYPDIVKTHLKIKSDSPPKPIVSRISGQLFKVFVKENQEVKAGQTLAYLENEADHNQVLSLLNDLKKMQGQLIVEGKISSATFNMSRNMQLGELQPNCQTFFRAYSNYMLSGNIDAAKLRFTQALNTLADEIGNWKSKYVLSASQSGTIVFATIIQKNQILNSGQEVFYIVPKGRTHFWGEIYITQDNIAKIRLGQQVLIKLQGYPFEEYGMLKGKIGWISNFPDRENMFLSKVSINDNSFSGLKKMVKVETGMNASAEIITEDTSLLARIFKSITKGLK
jgi:multidrug resistance efflux pump